MFETLISNSRMKKELSLAITSNRPLHAYMFCGANGSGKLTAAKQFARELVGNSKDKADRGSHPDIIIIQPEQGKKLITVDAIRKMRADAFVNPSEGVRKIYIINGAHLLNESGQNALLTILEQPPSFAVFILLSEQREKMLPTVVSRCAVFEMEYVEADDGARFLQTEFANEPFEKLTTAMTAAQGNIGLAKQFLTDAAFEKNIKLCERALLCVADDNDYGVASIINTLTKDNATQFLSVLSMYLRDIIVHRTVGECDALVFGDSILKNANEFDKIDINALYNCTLSANEAIELINANVSLPLVTADVVIQLCGGEKVD